MRAITALAAGIAGSALAITGAMAAEERSFTLDVLWSTPISAFSLNRPPGTPYDPGPEPGSIFEAQAIDPDGKIVFLGTRIIAGKRVMALFTDVERVPSGNAVILALKGAHPFNFHLFSRTFGSGPRPFTLAAGAFGETWVGGGSNSYMDLASADHRDAYLAKIDGSGKTLWEKAYGNGGWRQILSMAAMAAGEVAVAGEDAGAGWLARIGADGNQLWERHLGNAKRNAIVSLSGNRVVVAGFESTGSGSTKDYQEHVAVWIVDGSGQILAHTRIRTAINTVRGSKYEKISAAAANEAIYALASWTGYPHAQPIEVSKLDLTGKLLWTTSLPDNFTHCAPALAVDPNGDAVVACAVDGQIYIYQIEQSSGGYRKSRIPLPGCDNGYSIPLFLAIRSDGSMILSGSPPELNTVPRCTWTGRLTESH